MASNYDPNRSPDSTVWLSLDEHVRIELVKKYHKKTGARLPKVLAHCMLHVIVETQIAEQIQSVVEAMKRLSEQGLSRHDCIHAIARVLINHLNETVQLEGPFSAEDSNQKYFAAVEDLQASDWLESE